MGAARFVLVVLGIVAVAAAACDDDPAPALADAADVSSDIATDAQDDAAADTEDVETGPPPPATVAGCDGAALYATDTDTSLPGPWPVGVRTLTTGRLTAEVWYPTSIGGETGFDQPTYDLRVWLPTSQDGKIPDEANPFQPCDCYRDAPIDADLGPFPVIVFIHGTAGFRTQSLTQMVHWASRGFVVVAADHPGLFLADTLALLCPDDASGANDLQGDVTALLSQLASPSGPWDFLSGRIALDRVAIAGHSAGGNAAAAAANQAGVRLVVPMASSAAAAESTTLESTLFLAGGADAVVEPSATTTAFEETAGPRRLVVLNNAGHLAFSDLCALENPAGDNILEVGAEFGVCGVEFAGALFDCSDTLLAPATGAQIVNHTTTIALESVLQCRTREGDPWAAAGETYGSHIAEIRAEPGAPQ